MSSIFPVHHWSGFHDRAVCGAGLKRAGQYFASVGARVVRGRGRFARHLLLRDQAELARNDDAMALLSVLFFLALISMKAVAILSIRFPWIMPFAAPVALAPLLATLLLNTRLGMVVAFSTGLIHGLVTGLSLPVAGWCPRWAARTAVAFASRGENHSANSADRFDDRRRAGVGGIFSGRIAELARARDVDRNSSPALVSGFVAGMISIALLPDLKIYSRMSNVRLLELAAANHPLLQKMSIELPGTYHHSMIMAVCSPKTRITRSTRTDCCAALARTSTTSAKW